jgi:hypothetical protein
MPRAIPDAFVACQSGEVRSSNGVATPCGWDSGIFSSLSAPTGIGDGAFAQSRQPVPQGQIRVEVSLVNILASVLDANNRPAPDLGRDQFQVYEEGKLQKIEVFEPETHQPLDLVLMMDTSLSEIADLAFESEAAANFIGRGSAPGRSSRNIRVCGPGYAVEWVFRRPAPVAVSSAAASDPATAQPYYDAVYLGSQALAKGEAGRRRVIVLITDAVETTSRADFEEARREALRTESLLYTIVVRSVKGEGGRNTPGNTRWRPSRTVPGAPCIFRANFRSWPRCSNRSISSCVRNTVSATTLNRAPRPASTVRLRYGSRETTPYVTARPTIPAGRANIEGRISLHLYLLHQGLD